MTLSLEVAVADGTMRVTFGFFKDRYGHRVDLVTGHAVVPLATSCEGNEQDAWPASPPVQQLAFHRHPSSGKRFLLGVGMAGQSHWSLSVEADPTALAIVWDVACRICQPAPWLGSTYRLCGPIEPSDDVFQGALMQSRFEWYSAPQRPGEGECTIERMDEFLRIIPCPNGQESGTLATVRWRYGLRVVSSGDEDPAASSLPVYSNQ